MNKQQLYKNTIQLIMLAILAYTAFYLTSPQGKELIECRQYAPGLQIVKDCAANNSHLTCIENNPYINWSTNTIGDLK